MTTHTDGGNGAHFDREGSSQRPFGGSDDWSQTHGGCLPFAPGASIAKGLSPSETRLKQWAASGTPSHVMVLTLPPPPCPKYDRQRNIFHCPIPCHSSATRFRWMQLSTIWMPSSTKPPPFSWRKSNTKSLFSCLAHGIHTESYAFKCSIRNAKN